MKIFLAGASAVIGRSLGPRFAGAGHEAFNAIPAFLEFLHLTRRKFWIPSEDKPVAGWPDAYTVAGEAIEALETFL